MLCSLNSNFQSWMTGDKQFLSNLLKREGTGFKNTLYIYTKIKITSIPFFYFLIFQQKFNLSISIFLLTFFTIRLFNLAFLINFYLSSKAIDYFHSLKEKISLCSSGSLYTSINRVNLEMRVNTI